VPENQILTKTEFSEESQAKIAHKSLIIKYLSKTNLRPPALKKPCRVIENNKFAKSLIAL
jgi:hypothetical protein